MYIVLPVQNCTSMSDLRLLAILSHPKKNNDMNLRSCLMLKCVLYDSHKKLWQTKQALKANLAGQERGEIGQKNLQEISQKW